MGGGIKPFPGGDHKEMKLLVYDMAYLPVLQNKTLSSEEASSKTSQWNPYTLHRVFQLSPTAKSYMKLLY